MDKLRNTRNAIRNIDIHNVACLRPFVPLTKLILLHPKAKVTTITDFGKVYIVNKLERSPVDTLGRSFNLNSRKI